MAVKASRLPKYKSSFFFSFLFLLLLFQLRLAHEAYQFESRGCVFVADHEDGQASMDGEHRYADEWHWDLSGVSAACPKIKQATFLCASTAERAWLFPRLQAHALEK